MPLDPGRDWLAAGITGIPRQREWDTVATLAAPGAPGAEIEFVALPDGTFVVESEGAPVDAAALAEALATAIERPFRAVGRRGDDVWAVGAVAIDVASLDPDPGGDELELTWDGSVASLSVNGVPTDATRGSALERIASGRVSGAYAAHAHRLRGNVWELSVLAL